MGWRNLFLWPADLFLRGFEDLGDSFELTPESIKLLLLAGKGLIQVFEQMLLEGDFGFNVLETRFVEGHIDSYSLKY